MPRRPSRGATRVRAGRAILELMTQLAGAAPPAARPRIMPRIAERLAATWAAGRGSPAAPGAMARLLDAALILVADHELNAAAFAARVVASTGASPYAAVAAGLATLQGIGLGGDTAHIAALFDELATSLADSPPAYDDPEGARRRIRAELRRRRRAGARIPGFGHRLYADGDPRGRTLLDLIAAHERALTPAGRAACAAARATAGAMRDEAGLEPAIDFALVALCRAIGAPTHAPLTLFALGRSAGLVAHVMEQYAMQRVLRPRAQYTGPRPVGRER